MLLSLPYLCDEWLIMLILVIGWCWLILVADSQPLSTIIGHCCRSRVNYHGSFLSFLEKPGVLQLLYTVADSLKSGGGLAIGNDSYDKLIEPPINGWSTIK